MVYHKTKYHFDSKGNTLFELSQCFNIQRSRLCILLPCIRFANFHNHLGLFLNSPCIPSSIPRCPVPCALRFFL